MDQYTVNLSDAARDDIREMYAYLNDILCDHKSAVWTFEGLKQAVLSLETIPMRRPLVSDEEFASKGIRSLRSGRYLIFYVVAEEPHIVLVARALHERREWKALLAGPESEHPSPDTTRKDD